MFPETYTLKVNMGTRYIKKIKAILYGIYLHNPWNSITNFSQNSKKRKSAPAKSEETNGHRKVANWFSKGIKITPVCGTDAKAR